MAGAKIEYDESGSTFYYFVVSFFALVLIPGTYYLWPKSQEKDDPEKQKYECKCSPCKEKRLRLNVSKPWESFRRKLIKVGLIACWILLMWMIYKISTLERDHVEYDPYEVLQIDRGASVSEIKKQYRTLSLIYHPDKETGDEVMFMKIAKAYAALTNEESRKNWEEYGNPDGPGAMTFGIALPSWIVEKQNSIWVLAAYALVFMVALPIVVGTWWYRSIKYSGDQVLLDTTQMYFYFFNKTPHMMLKRALMILAASMEFEKGHNPEVQERPSDNIELPQLIKDLPQLGEKNKEKPFCYPFSVKARALLHSHLSRIDLPRTTLELDKLYILKKCPNLLNEMVNCIATLVSYGRAGRVQHTPSLDTVEHVMKLSQMVVQGIWDNKSPLLQLPHFSEDILRHCITKKRRIKTIRDLVTMKEEERRLLLRTLSDEQYQDVLNVCKTYPCVDFDVVSKVLDDEDVGIITAGAIVTMEVQLNRSPYEQHFEKEQPTVPAAEMIDEKDEEEEEKVQQQQNQQQKRKPKVWEKQKKKSSKGGKKNKEKSNKVINRRPVTTVGPTQQTDDRNVKPNGKGDNNESGTPKSTKSAKDKAKYSDSDADSEGGDSDSESDAPSLPVIQGEESEGEEENWDSFDMKKRKQVLESKSRISHSVHCPYFPEDKQEFWWVYVADKKHKQLLTPPYLVTDLVDNEEVTLKFPAPMKPGAYTYYVVCRSDSYLDFDVLKSIKLDVKEAKEVPEDHPQWDISDEDEGQMEEELTEDYTTDNDDSE